jgi:hypothetical protein
MKKIFLTVAIATSMLLISSCKKEKPCNCGTITDDAIEFDANSNMFYSLTITNDCSGNSGKYYFDYSVWLDANVGEYFCITNVSSWMPVGETTVHKVENKEIQ